MQSQIAVVYNQNSMVHTMSLQVLNMPKYSLNTYTNIYIYSKKELGMAVKRHGLFQNRIDDSAFTHAFTLILELKDKRKGWSLNTSL